VVQKRTHRIIESGEAFSLEGLGLDFLATVSFSDKSGSSSSSSTASSDETQRSVSSITRFPFASLVQG